MLWEVGFEAWNSVSAPVSCNYKANFLKGRVGVFYGKSLAPCWLVQLSEFEYHYNEVVLKCGFK
jgi:hypothetical protein